MQQAAPTGYNLETLMIQTRKQFTRSIPFQSFKETPYGQKGNYGPDFDESIRVVENHKNTRDLR